MHCYTYKPSQEALEKRRAAAMDLLAVLAIAAGLTLLWLLHYLSATRAHARIV